MWREDNKPSPLIHRNFIYSFQNFSFKRADRNYNIIVVVMKKVIKEMTGGGVDYSFECIGLASLMEEAFNSSRTVSFFYRFFYLVVQHSMDKPK